MLESRLHEEIERHLECGLVQPLEQLDALALVEVVKEARDEDRLTARRLEALVEMKKGGWK